MYDGGVIVDRSQALLQPVIYVSMNYRLTGFGFLPGKEVKDAGVGNLGLHDRQLLLVKQFKQFKYQPQSTERQALRWIQKYISQFGGDPTKVTM